MAATTEPTCPLCGGPNHRTCFAVAGHDLLNCLDCRLFFVHPQPAGAADPPPQMRPAMSPEKQRLYDIQFYNRYFPQIAPWCRDAGAILDVGCGTGRLLELLGRDERLVRVGLEPDPAKAAFATRAAGCPIHQTTLERFRSDRPFDVITLINVLSHIPSFDDLFTSVRSLLAPGGRLLVMTGELGADVRPGDLPDWALGEHVHFLGLGTIDHVCRQYGLELLACERRPYAQERFAPEALRTPGRSRTRRVLKRLIAAVPRAPGLLAKAYELRHGRRVWSSFFVLGVKDAQTENGG